MKVFTPEISWHQKEPIFSVDFCNSTWKLASAGADFTIKIWQVKEDNEGNIGLDFLANLDRHSKPVNCVRFSPDGKFLASAGDDCIIIIWKLSEDEDEHMITEPAFGSEDIVNKEKWIAHKMLRRGHLEDIYDLAWSPDGNQLVSGSVDNSAIIWDVSKGHFTNIIKDHKHYVQGVCWDPRGQYVVTHSSDRTCKLYSLSKNRCVHTIQKSTFPISNPVEDGPKQKSSKLFMDETMQSFFRRCCFSPDGLLLALPGGIYDSGEKPVKATYVYTRGGFSKPALCLPGSKKASVGVCFCPVIFENMGSAEGKENQPANEGLFKLPYRMCYAVATLNSVVFYDTQHPHPFGFVSNIHYASLTDMAWSSDGRIVVVSSLDGYCSIVSFENRELGRRSSLDPMEYVSSKLKEKREAKKEAKKVQVEDGADTTVVNDREKEHTAGVRPSPARSKDQPTLHQFVTPVRKRKRNMEKDESPQSLPASSPSASTPTLNIASNKTPVLMTDKDSPDSPVDLTWDAGKSSTCTPPGVVDQQKTNQVSSLTKSTKTPKRANLISLGFKPISKPPANPTMASKEGKVADVAEVASESSTHAQQGKPRRINFTTTDSCQTSSSSTCSPQLSTAIDHSRVNDTQQSRVDVVQNQTAPNCSDILQQGKTPRRVPLVSLPAKRSHSEITETSAVDTVSNQTAIKPLIKQTGNINDSIKISDKPKADPQIPEVKDKWSVDLIRKANRRVEVITLLDESPEKTQPQKICDHDRQCFAGLPESNVVTKAEITGDPSCGSKVPVNCVDPSKSLALESSPLVIGSQKCAVETQLDITSKSQNTPGRNATYQKDEVNVQPSSKELDLDGQSKVASPPAIKAPKRVEFVTLSSNNSK